ncbi:MAG: WXG100 family type VII secretion target [Rhodoluna sp.]
MTQFTVDSEQVRAANSAIQGTITRINHEVDFLHGQLLGLQSTWTGLAANSFQELAAAWRSTSATIEAQLAALGDALALAANQYSEIELANQRLFL